MGLCGPSAQEKMIAGQQESLATSLSADFNQRFQNQSDLLSTLNTSLSPIVAAGPEQQGFSAQELAARNTQAINSVGAASRNAQQAAATAGAGQGGGGTSGLESGIQKQINAGIASSGANALANEQNQITSENYATGRSNYKTALTGADALAGKYDPTSFSSGAETGLGSAFKEADTIQQEKGSQIASIIGAVTGGIGGLVGGLGNLDTTGSSSAGEQALNFAEGV